MDKYWTEEHPNLLQEWHPSKNPGINPMSSKLKDKVWWRLPYDDPETGKHFDFEWRATIASRIQGNGCPFLSGKAVWPGFNDLTTKRPDLAAQWHPTKNNELTPGMVTYGSGKKVWWYLPYHDPETGKHFDFEWQATIANRIKDHECPYLLSRAVWPGYNDLETKRPDLAMQWHPTKNGKLTPEMVTCGSGRKVWWYLPYDDPITGKHFCFEWQASMCNRMRTKGCPFLTGQAVWLGYNDLATKCPDLAAQWHPTKNGSLLPEMVTCYSNKKVWWCFPYDDPVTGKHFCFEWQASICNRMRAKGCPFLTNQAIWLGYNDLATKRPDLAAQWHPTKNGSLLPEMVTCYSNKKVWWYLPYDDPETGKHFNFEWQACVNECAQGRGCPFLSGQAVWLGYNDLATKQPDLAAQWHPTLNGDVTPGDVKPNTKVKYYWLLPFDDEKTGKHFDFVWKASPNERVNGNGCPYLSGKAIWIGYNDLETTHPLLALEWHPWRNGSLKPTDVTRGKPLKVWWYLPYDDPLLGHFDFEWEAWIADRAKGAGCPYLTGNAVWPGFNDLTTSALWMAKQWHPTKNGDLKPADITCNHHKKVWWLYPYDDPVLGHFDFEWEASPNTRMTEPGCPFLEGNGVWPGYNDLLSRYPVVASQFHPTKNGNVSPKEISFASNKTYWWYLPYDDPDLGHFDFEWKAKVVNRTLLGAECPYVGNDKVWKGYNDLLSCMPHIARDWHSTKNRRLRPDEVYKESTKKVWWKCSQCGYEWFGSVRGRTVNGIGCKKCHRNNPFIL